MNELNREPNFFLKTLALSSFITVFGSFFFRVIVLGTLLSGVLLLNRIIPYSTEIIDFIYVLLGVVFYCFIPSVIIIANLSYRSNTSKFMTMSEGATVTISIIIIDFIIIWIITSLLNFKLLISNTSPGLTGTLYFDILIFNILSAIIGFIIFIYLPLYYSSTKFKNITLRNLLTVVTISAFVLVTLIASIYVYERNTRYREVVVKNSVNTVTEQLKKEHKTSIIPTQILSFNVYLDRKQANPAKSPFNKSHYVYDRKQGPGVVTIKAIDDNTIEITGYGKRLEILKKESIKFPKAMKIEEYIKTISGENKPLAIEMKTTKPKDKAVKIDKPAYIGKFCSVKYGNYYLEGIPENIELYVRANGISAGTEKSAYLIKNMADQLAINDNFKGAQEFKEFSSLIYLLSRVQKRFEIAALYCKQESNSEDCFHNKLLTAGYGSWPKYYELEGILPDYDKSNLSILDDPELTNIAPLGYVAHLREANPAIYSSLKTKYLSFAINERYNKIINNPAYSKHTKELINKIYRNISALQYYFTANIHDVFDTSIDSKGKSHESLVRYDPISGRVIKDKKYIIRGIDTIIEPLLTFKSAFSSQLKGKLYKESIFTVCQ